MKKKDCFKALPFFLVVSLLPALAVPSFAEDKLTVAVLRGPSEAPFWAGLEAGFFKEYGLELLPVQFGSGAQTIMTMMAGDVQMTTTGGPAAVNAKLTNQSIIK